MSLNWDCSRVENYQEKADKQWTLLETLIWSSMSIGMGKLTKHNVDEWVYRLNRIELENCSDRRWTEEEVSTFIGLRTNVGTVTATEFDQVLKKRHPERYKITRKELDAE